MPNNKLNVLITRPEKAGRSLVLKCQVLGIPAWHQPLFSYQANLSKTALTKQVTSVQQPIVIFVSVAAVEFAEAQLPISTWQASLAIGVGTATQKALAKVGVAALCPKTHTSEGLLSLTELNNIDGQDVLTVRGDGGREMIAEQLAARGAKVQYLETYRKDWLVLSEDISKTWQQKNINTLVITSNALLESVVNLIDLCDNYWQNTCLWIVASDRIAEKARAFGLQQVINAQGASDEAILAVLREYGIE